MATDVTALDVVGLMRLEDGRMCSAALDYQRVNATAILDVDDPVRQTWIEAARGTRKTTDLAAVLLAILAGAGTRHEQVIHRRPMRTRRQS